MDFRFRTDIDAARRLIHDQNARLGDEPFRQHYLLLIASRQLADNLLGAAGADAEAGDGIAGKPHLAQTVDDIARSQALEHGE